MNKCDKELLKKMLGFMSSEMHVEQKHLVKLIIHYLKENKKACCNDCKDLINKILNKEV